MKKLLNKLKHHKLVTVLSLILLLVTGNFAYNRYLDWDNAQMIKGLARDFPQLVREVEQATGLELEIKSNCNKTQEKFSSGVKVCGLLVVRNEIDDDQLTLAKSIIENSSKFPKKVEEETERAYRAKYRRKTACTVSNRDRLFFECLTGVREQNTELARNTFLDIE